MTEREYESRLKDINICIDKMFELSVNADKLRAAHDSFGADALMDYSKLDVTQKACLIEHHAEHNLLFAITTDYLLKVTEQIDDVINELSAIKDSLQETRQHEVTEASKDIIDKISSIKNEWILDQLNKFVDNIQK